VISYFWFFIAAAFEIAGCYTFWMWLRQDKSLYWLLPGILCLVLFAFVLTRVEAELAGRSYAAYGGIYIVASLIWLSSVEKSRILLTDYIGVILCLFGAGIILFDPKFENASGM